MKKENQVSEIVLDTIRSQQLLSPGDSVIVALSGGADSVALFFLLLENRRALGISLLAAHLNHGLRGAASDGDEDFVRVLCQREGVRLYVRRAEMATAERPKGEGTEAWARRLRYAFFEELAAENEAKVATGHTGSDNAETVLFHAIRGGFTSGLSGIRPVRGVYRRPLLEVTRDEVRTFCQQKGYAYREDASNEDVAYTRNLLRLSAMPVLEKAHPGAQRALCRLSKDMRALDDWLTEQANSALCAAQTAAENLEDPPGWRLPAYSAQTLVEAPTPVRLKALARLAGPSADRAALARMEDVLLGRAAAAQLPGGRQLRMAAGERLLLVAGGAPEQAGYEMECKPGKYVLPGGYRLEVGLEDLEEPWEKNQKKQKKSYTFIADYDKINQYGILRTRRPGDFFSPQGRGVRKSMKKWMIEAGIDRELRGLLPLLAEHDTGRVLWVCGAGFCQSVQPGDSTKKILYICAVYDKRGENGG